MWWPVRSKRDDDAERLRSTRVAGCWLWGCASRGLIKKRHTREKKSHTLTTSCLRAAPLNLQHHPPALSYLPPPRRKRRCMVAYIDQNSFADIWRYVQGHNILLPAILLIFVSVFFTRRPRPAVWPKIVKR